MCGYGQRVARVTHLPGRACARTREREGGGGGKCLRKIRGLEAPLHFLGAFDCKRAKFVNCSRKERYQMLRTVSLAFQAFPRYNRPMESPALPPVPQGQPTAEASAIDAMLAQMASSGRQAAVERIGKGSLPSVRPPKIRYTHEAMADLMLENPWISQDQLAAHFGYSPAWISTVVTSNAFQAFYASRRAELLDPELRLTLEERFRALTTKSLQVLQEKLSRPADQVSDQLALRAAELGAKSLGIGGNAPPPPPPNPAEYLPAIAERLMRLQGRSMQSVSDATIIQASAP